MFDGSFMNKGCLHTMATVVMRMHADHDAGESHVPRPMGTERRLCSWIL